MAGNEYLLNKFVKKRKRGSLSSIPDNGVEQKFIDIESICNFLEFQGIQFLEEDVVYVLKDLGIKGSQISYEDLEKFIDSSLWN
jgi:hypothetical protein